MSKILVTGGSGFIGSHIVEHFHETDEVVVLDNLRTGFRKNVKNFNCQFIEGNVTDVDLVKEVSKGVDYIFHLAALVSVPESMENPQLTVEINTTATLNLLMAARDNGVQKIVLSSSAAIYGDNPVVPKIETMFPEPKSPYAVTKLDGEYYFKMFSDEYGLATTCLRYFNVFGPRQDPKSQYAAAVPIFIDKSIKNEDITIFGDGEQTRDFIYVKDIVRANVKAATSGAKGVFNVARGGRITINELAKQVINLTGSRSKINYAPERAGDVKHSQADISKLQSIGFESKFDLDVGLRTTIEFFSNKESV
ncbi:SDR family oxidoreductase [candidate division KSB1 bacterium]|nr:SDR family oxidoreductase [candidate division KSB1 bacterium]